MILDSSKDPRRLLDLYKEPRINLKIIYLVRDPRAYALSLSRRFRIKRNLPTKPYLISLMEWVGINWITRKIIKQKQIPFIKINYKQFCENPERTMKQISNLLGVNVIIKDGYFQHHNICGNGRTLSQTKLEIKFREQWRQEIPILSRIALSFFFLPFRHWLVDKL